MHGRIKKMVITGMLIGMSIPFVLLTDLYPFFRFGMFAEPVRRTIQTETFALRVIDSTGKFRYLQPHEIGLSSLAYLMRNYYYRGEARKLLIHIHANYHQRKELKEWQLVKITSRTLAKQDPDSVVVAKLPLP